MKLTTSKSIIIGSVLIALAILFRADASFVPEAKAEVAGKGYYELRSDHDFRRATEHIIEEYIAENCRVFVSANGGYVSNNYLYDLNVFAKLYC